MADQTSGDLGPKGGTDLGADQTRSREGAGPVACQISFDVGPPPKQQRGEAKAEAPARRKVRREASPPGLPLEAATRRGEASPPGPPLETAARRREASPPGPPLAKTCPLAPPSRNGFQTFPKQGGRRGLEPLTYSQERKALELKAPEAEALEPEALKTEVQGLETLEAESAGAGDAGG